MQSVTKLSVGKLISIEVKSMEKVSLAAALMFSGIFFMTFISFRESLHFFPIPIYFLTSKSSFTSQQVIFKHTDNKMTLNIREFLK